MCVSRLRRRGLEEVHLQEALEVQVGYLLAVLHAQELGQLRVRLLPEFFWGGILSYAFGFTDRTQIRF